MSRMLKKAQIQDSYVDGLREVLGGEYDDEKVNLIISTAENILRGDSDASSLLDNCWPEEPQVTTGSGKAYADSVLSTLGNDSEYNDHY